MGKGKGKRRKDVAIIEAPDVAERHGFDAGGMLGHTVGDYAVNVTERVALGVDVVLACVRTIADLVADADVGEYRGTTRLDDESRLTRRPMQSVTRRTWLWTVAATMALYNGTYVQEVGGRDSEGVPLSLVPISPSRVSVMRPGPMLVDGREVDPSTMRWVPRMTFPTVSGDIATMISLARNTFAAAASSDIYRAAFWEKGGSPLLQITSDQELNETDADLIRDQWVEKRLENPGAPAVFGKGAGVKPIGVDLAADGASSAVAATGSSIARWFGMPAWLVNVATSAGSMTYSNVAGAGLDLVRYTLQPGYAGPIGDALSEYLPGDYLYGRRTILGLTHLTRGTILEQAQAYAIATGNRPWMLPHEVRNELHLPMDMSLDDAGAPAPAMEAIPV